MSLAWSVCVVDRRGEVIEESNADDIHATASVGKVFLLCEAAQRIVDGQLDPSLALSRDSGCAVGDSGIWQYMSQDSLPLADACLLVACVSDNWATNALLDLIGLESVGRRALSLGCERSRLHDCVRDVRTGDHPANLSTGTARELAEVARRIHSAARGGDVDGLSVDAAMLVERWLITGVDLSMVAAPFLLDPLAHTQGRVMLWSKTGTDTCIRADVGVAWIDAEELSYAAIGTWAPGDDAVGASYERMHALGSRLVSRLW